MVSPADLSGICSDAVDAAVSQFPGLDRSDIGISLASLDGAEGTYEMGGFREDWMVYPASVVKTFYIAYGASLLDAGSIELTEEHERGFRDMIVDSSNDATGLVLDLVTDTTGGAELPADEMAVWMEKRQAVNRWLVGRGITGVNACQKTWNEGPYGRERLGYGSSMELRNMASAEACAKMMCEIKLGLVASADRTSWMLGFFERGVESNGEEPDGQTRNFIGKVVPKGCTLWSKAGLAYETRHDVACVRAPDGREFVMAIMTDHNIGNAKLVPFLAERILRSVGVIEGGEERWDRFVAEVD
jgi:hypothetical protein